MTTARVWFITGASRGLGRAFAEAALGAGDRVVAAARDLGPLDDLAAAHPDDLVRLELDVTDRAAVQAVVDRPRPRSAGSTSWSTTPARCCSAWSRSRPRSRSAPSSTSTSSAPYG